VSAELIAGGVALLLALAGGIAGWSQIRKHGRALEERDRAREERDAAIKRADEAARPPLSGPESVDTLRRVRDDGLGC
jgi:uncharacterized protein HemX